jgi:molybdate transport system substrate-binding protein
MQTRPAKGGLSGVYFARVLERLEIADQMSPRPFWCPATSRPRSPLRVRPRSVSLRRPKIVPVAGAQLVGPLAGDLNLVTVFSAGLGSGAKAFDAATSFVKFITGRAVASVLKAGGR